MKKDCTTYSKACFITNGATAHSVNEREKNDYYATEPKAVELLLEKERFNLNIWEPACGEGHITKVLTAHGYSVVSSDLVDRGACDFTFDFLTAQKGWTGDIVTNPPYRYAKEFVEKALEVVQDGRKVAMLLKLTFLESKKRRKLFDKAPPKTIYVASACLNCARNGDFETMASGAMAYAWFVWEKGFKGDPIIKWVN